MKVLYCCNNLDLNRQLLRKRAELEVQLIEQKKLNVHLKQRYTLLHRAYDQLLEHNEEKFQD